MSMEESVGQRFQGSLSGAWPDASKPNDQQQRKTNELAGRMALSLEDLVIDTFKDAKRRGAPWREAIDEACEAAAMKTHRKAQQVRDQVVRIVEAYSTRL